MKKILISLLMCFSLITFWDEAKAEATKLIDIPNLALQGDLHYIPHFQRFAVGPTLKFVEAFDGLLQGKVGMLGILDRQDHMPNVLYTIGVMADVGKLMTKLKASWVLPFSLAIGPSYSIDIQDLTHPRGYVGVVGTVLQYKF